MSSFSLIPLPSHHGLLLFIFSGLEGKEGGDKNRDKEHREGLYMTDTIGSWICALWLSGGVAAFSVGLFSYRFTLAASHLHVPDQMNVLSSNSSLISHHAISSVLSGEAFLIL